MPYLSKKDQANYGKKWYQDNKQQHSENVRKNTKRRRQELSLYVFNYKLAHPCLKCKETDPCCLQFHHKEAKEKDLEISIAIRNGWSNERLQKEIDKCIILCANCHAKEHCSQRLKNKSPLPASA